MNVRGPGKSSLITDLLLDVVADILSSLMIEYILLLLVYLIGLPYQNSVMWSHINHLIQVLPCLFGPKP